MPNFFDSIFKKDRRAVRDTPTGDLIVDNSLTRIKNVVTQKAIKEREAAQRRRKKELDKTFVTRIKEAAQKAVKKLKDGIARDIERNKNLYGSFDDYVQHNLDLYGSFDDFVEYNRYLYRKKPVDEEDIKDDRELRAIINELVEDSSDRMRGFGVALRDGEITPDEFAELMRDEIKILHTSTGIAGSGDLVELNDRALESAQDRIESELEFLDNFVNDVRELLEMDDNLNRVPSRAAQYGQAGRGTASEAERDQLATADDKDDGLVTQEKREINAGENCPECLEYEADGWVPLGTLPAIGSGSRCGSHCNCRFRYRRVRLDRDGNAIVDSQRSST